MEPRRQTCSTGSESDQFGAWGFPNQRFGISKRISPKHCWPTLSEISDYLRKYRDRRPEVRFGQNSFKSRRAAALSIQLSKNQRLKLSNNRAEESIKPFAIDRKDFLFADTTSGAKSTAIFSL